MKFAIKSKLIFNKDKGTSERVYYVTQEVYHPKKWWHKEYTDSFYCFYDNWRYENNNKLVAFNNEGTWEFDFEPVLADNVYLPTYDEAKRFLDHMVSRNQEYNNVKKSKPETLCYVEIGSNADMLKTVKELIAGFDDLTKQEFINSLK